MIAEFAQAARDIVFRRLFKIHPMSPIPSATGGAEKHDGHASSAGFGLTGDRDVSLGRIGREERVDELIDQRVGHLRLDPVVLGPFVREVERAEDPVEPGEGRRVVPVDRAGACVMPVVKCGGREQPLQRAETPA